MTQYGFFIDLSRCIGCQACVIACKQWYDIKPGPVRWMRVHQWETGAFPNTRLHMLPVTCFHCEDPVCARACPQKAISKETRYGAVIVDSSKCTGERKCWQACPYGAPQYEGDEPGLKMSKCDMCLDRLEEGLKPICVLSCSMRALEFGALDELKKRYGDTVQIADLPKNSLTQPAVIYKPVDAKKQIIPWDSARALELWQKRQPSEGAPLPDIFSEPAAVTQPPEGILSRDRLVLKGKTTAERDYHARDDE